MRRGVDVLVATPGRLEDLMEQRTVDLSQTDIVIVDEADRMADMGFLPAVRRILDRTATKSSDDAVLRDARRRHRRPRVAPTRTTRCVTTPGPPMHEPIDAKHHFWLGRAPRPRRAHGRPHQGRRSLHRLHADPPRGGSAGEATLQARRECRRHARRTFAEPAQPSAEGVLDAIEPRRSSPRMLRLAGSTSTPSHR